MPEKTPSPTKRPNTAASLPEKPQRYRITLIGSRAAEVDRLHSMLASAGHTLTQQVIPAGGSLTLDQSSDLHIICLPEGFRVFDPSTSSVWVPAGRPILYISHESSAQIRQYIFQHAGRDLLLYPYSEVDLQFRIQRLMATDPARSALHFTEPRMLAFLDDLISKNVRVITPELDPFAPRKHFYPQVADFFGRLTDDFEFLERLATEGILERAAANRVRLCAKCGETSQNYRETCPKCSSLDIVQTEVIHHFTCGYVGALDVFRRGATLVCPKCEKILRHIGLDYEKPARHFACAACGYVFADPLVEAQCLHCGFVCKPCETVSLTIYRYKLTPLARQSVAERRIGGMNLSFLLRNVQTGLFTRQFFEHEMAREFYRSQRSANPFCLLLIRVVGIEKIRSTHAEQASEYLTSIFKAISSNLRILDITCVWDADLLAVLLPETPQEGGLLVARRMREKVKSLEYLYSIYEPDIEVSLVAWNPTYATTDDMIQVAVQDMQSQDVQSDETP